MKKKSLEKSIKYLRVKPVNWMFYILYICFMYIGVSVNYEIEASVWSYTCIGVMALMTLLLFGMEVKCLKGSCAMVNDKEYYTRNKVRIESQVHTCIRKLILIVVVVLVCYMVLECSA